MKVIEAIADRLGEPQLRDLPTRCVDLRVSRTAMFDLVCELDSASFKVRRAGKGRFTIFNGEGERAFSFSMDERLPGKSFVMRVKEGK